jgi:hypothetical protein
VKNAEPVTSSTQHFAMTARRLTQATVRAAASPFRARRVSNATAVEERPIQMRQENSRDDLLAITCAFTCLQQRIDAMPRPHALDLRVRGVCLRRQSVAICSSSGRFTSLPTPMQKTFAFRGRAPISSSSARLEEVARRTDLDRRTVKRCLAQAQGGPGG